MVFMEEKKPYKRKTAWERAKKHLPEKKGRIDPGLIERLGATHLSNDSVATILQISRATLETTYLGDLQKAREKRKQTLSEKVWAKALEGNDTTMLIWLSKQHLGYKEPKNEDQAPNNVFNITIAPIPKLEKKEEPKVIEPEVTENSVEEASI